MSNVKIAYQLYSARDDAARDLPGTLKALSDMGYDGIEFAGFYGHEASDVRAMLDKLGLVGISDHLPLSAIEQDMNAQIAYHQAVGCRYIAVPYLDDAHRPGTKGFASVMRTLYAFGALCRDSGIQLLYHNHDFEFATLSDMYALDFMYAAVPEDILKTEIDLCWVKYAGLEPTAYLSQYAGRCPLVHLKDYVGRRGEGTPYALIGLDKPADSNVPFEFRPFGYGCQDAKALVECAVASGAQWLVVEQDASVGRTPLEAAKMSVDTVKKILG